jgi:hypothetical protein
MGKKQAVPQNESELVDALLAQLQEANASANAETGACLISTPGSPRPTCAQLTPQQCRAINGVYVGGKCP